MKQYTVINPFKGKYIQPENQFEQYSRRKRQNFQENKSKERKIRKGKRNQILRSPLSFLGPPKNQVNYTQLSCMQPSD